VNHLFSFFTLPSKCFQQKGFWRFAGSLYPRKATSSFYVSQQKSEMARHLRFLCIVAAFFSKSYNLDSLKTIGPASFPSEPAQDNRSKLKNS